MIAARTSASSGLMTRSRSESVFDGAICSSGTISPVLGRLYWMRLWWLSSVSSSMRIPVCRNVSTAAQVQNARSSCPLMSRRWPVSGSSPQIRAGRSSPVTARFKARSAMVNVAPGAVARAAASAAVAVVRVSLTRATSMGRAGRRSRVRWSMRDLRTRARLPALPRLVAGVNDTRTTATAALAAARATAPGATFTIADRALKRAVTGDDRPARIWGEDPDTGQRRDMSGHEDRAFWTWAAVETLRHTGIRIEELTELSHHSLIQYNLPSTGEIVPLLQIAPSKTDSERLLVISSSMRRRGL